MSTEPSLAEIAKLPGPAVLEFGARWCGWCRAAQPLLAEAFAAYPGLRHIKIEDGPGRRLGRFFKVKLWPTLVFLKDGQEQTRLVRPSERGSIDHALALILQGHDTPAPEEN